MTNESREKVVSKKSRIRIEREQQQKKYLINGSIIIGALVLLVILYGILEQVVFQQYKPVAKVNGQVISVNQFKDRVRFERLQLVQQYVSTYQTFTIFGTSDQNFTNYFKDSLEQIYNQLNDSETLGQGVLNQMVQDLAISQEAEKRNITVSDEKITTELQSAFGYYPDGTPIPTATATMASTSTLSPTQLAMATLTFTPTSEPTTETTPTSAEIAENTENAPEGSPDATATLTPTPYTHSGYETQVATYLDGAKEAQVSQKDLENLFHQSLLRQQMYEIITADMRPEEERVWARHILVESEEEAVAVLNRIKAGEDWSVIAAEVSQDASNKDKGGDLGWFNRGKMVAEFDAAAFALEIAEISEPIETSFGFHIIQVLGHEMRPMTSYEFETARQEKFTEWLTEITSEEKAQTFDIWKDVVPLEPTIPEDYLTILYN